ncbi:MAG: hypothetical protein JXA92_10360 [candidate division Zixibacteria bacterium]|nr:hypothetical protein [candidate division Zixibacteria bacterium]
MRPSLIRNPTKNKLNEAKFFLSEMKKNIQDEEKFCYFLSAFIQSARNITFAMQKQYMGNNEFEVWYKQQQEKMKNDLELEYLNDARVETVHRKPITTGIMGAVGLSQTVDLVKAGEEPPPSKKKLKDSNYPKSDSIIVDYTFVYFNNVPVIPYCESQVIKLEKLVSECEDKFLKNKHIG